MFHLQRNVFVTVTLFFQVWFMLQDAAPAMSHAVSGLFNSFGGGGGGMQTLELMYSRDNECLLQAMDIITRDGQVPRVMAMCHTMTTTMDPMVTPELQQSTMSVANYLIIPHTNLSPETIQCHFPFQGRQ